MQMFVYSGAQYIPYKEALTIYLFSNVVQIKSNLSCYFEFITTPCLLSTECLLNLLTCTMGSALGQWRL